MANIIRSSQVDGGVKPAVFGGAAPDPTAGQPLNAPRVDRRGHPVEALPSPEPKHALPEPARPEATAPAPQPVQPPPPPAEPPVFEVPAEILQGIYDQAVVQGLEDGKNQVLAELHVLQERYATAIDQLVGVSRELEAHNRVQLLSLACTIAQKLVRGHLQANPQEMLTLVGEALDSVEARGEIVITVGPDDHAFLAERREELTEGAGGTFTVKIAADRTLEYGDFRVETASGSVDGRVATRMAEAEQALGGADV